MLPVRFSVNAAEDTFARLYRDQAAQTRTVLQKNITIQYSLQLRLLLGSNDYQIEPFFKIVLIGTNKL